MAQVQNDGPQRAKPWVALTYLCLALIGLVGMAEAGALVGEATPTGQDAPSSLFGYGQISQVIHLPIGTLTAWSHAAGQFSGLSRWLHGYSLFDLVFMVGYLGLGYAVFSRCAARRGAWLTLLGALAVANLVEQAGLWAFADDMSASRGFAWWLHLATLAKWLCVAALAVWFVCRERNAESRGLLRKTARALKVQRFSAVVVALLLVLAVARMSDILEQLPDIERAWLGSPTGWQHFSLAVIAQLLLAGLLLILGRRRVHRALDHYVSNTERRREAPWWPWILIAGALLAVAVPLAVWHTGLVDLPQSVVAAGVLVAVVIGSLFAKWTAPQAPRDAEASTEAASTPPTAGVVAVVETGSLLSGRITRRAVAAVVAAAAIRSLIAKRKAWLAAPAPSNAAATAPDVAATEPAAPAPAFPDPTSLGRLTQTVGDALALGAVAVTGIGLVRSMTAPALLARGVGGAYGVAVAAGIAVAVLTWLIGPYLDTNKVPGPADTQEAQELRSWRPLGLATVPFLLAGAFLLATPLAATHLLGVLGTIVVAIGVLGSVLSLLAYRVQTRKPLPLFQAMGLASTPALSLILVIAVIGGLVDSRPAVHQVRTAFGSPAVAAASAFDSKVQEWLRDPLTDACARSRSTKAGGLDVRVEPMVLVAAAGGGIRAAWWAERALALFAASTCLKHAVFAVSAVSGGSVGTAVLASAPTIQAADDAMTHLAGPDALAAAMDGLLLRDTVTGFTGIGVPSVPKAAGTTFPDRAGLMEAAWESPSEDPDLKQPFPLSTSLVPWRLLFNSTAVGTGCRAVIANSTLTPIAGRTPDTDATARHSLRCDLGSGVVASGTYDFLTAFPCMKGIPLARAAQLSARFPFVTPSGSVHTCSGPAATEQFVDGGYADSSGLATLADLAPAITAAIRVHNAAAVSQAHPGHPVTLVVPVVAALGNTAIPQPSTGAPTGTPEPLVPTHTVSLAATAQLTGSDALLQQLLAETAPDQWLACLPADSTCLRAQNAAVALAPDQTVLVSPSLQPSVPTPLGWTLSKNAQTELDNALQADANVSCVSGTPPTTTCPAGVGHLGDLLNLAHGPSESGSS